MSVHAKGQLPSSTPVDHIIADMAATQARGNRNVQLAERVCPVLTQDAIEGTYPKESGWFGLDESAMTPATDQSLTGEDYPELPVYGDSQAYRIERDLIASIKVADQKAQAWMATTGRDLNAYCAEKASRIASDHFIKKAMTLVGDSSLYDTDNTEDPGNITTSTFDFSGAIAYDAVEKLLAKNTYADGQPLTVLIGWDLVDDIMKLQQVRSRIGSVTGVASGELAGSVITTVLTMNEVERAVASFFPDGTECFVVKGKYKASDGTPTDFFANKIAVLSTGGPGEISFARCITQTGFNPIVDVKTEDARGFNGYEMFVQSFCDLLVETNSAGVLYTGLGS